VLNYALLLNFLLFSLFDCRCEDLNLFRGVRWLIIGLLVVLNVVNLFLRSLNFLDLLQADLWLRFLTCDRLLDAEHF